MEYQLLNKAIDINNIKTLHTDKELLSKYVELENEKQILFNEIQPLKTKLRESTKKVEILNNELAAVTKEYNLYKFGQKKNVVKANIQEKLK